MRNQEPSKLPFEGETPEQQKLWDALAGLPGEQPGEGLRREFYRGLAESGHVPWHRRLADWLGISGNSGWLTATACLVLGFGVAQLAPQGDSADDQRLAALEQNIALLNRDRVLARLASETTGTRLLGVQQATGVVGEDPEIARALLDRAAHDPSGSVRSAAIDALAPRLDSSMGVELMEMLVQADSPLVQWALVDLVLRNGSTEQLTQLERLAEDEALHPDLVTHVKRALGGTAI